MTLNKNLSASRINMLNMCGQKHYYAYTLMLERPGESNAQALGTAVHKAIEEFYDGKHQMPHTSEPVEWANEYNACVDAYGTFSLLKDAGMSVIETEKSFSVPIEDERISEGWNIRGIIDVVAKIDGQIIVMDHKTTRRKWPYEKTVLALQHKIYELAVMELYPNEEYFGSAYNFIQIGTSKGVPYANVTRTFLPQNASALNTAFEEIISAIQRIEHGPLYRNTGDHCGYCEFFALCQADYLQADTQSLIELNYRRKEVKPVGEPEEL